MKASLKAGVDTQLAQSLLQYCLEFLYTVISLCWALMDNSQLQGEFTFWFQKFQETTVNDFKNTLHPVITISTIQKFWAYYQHLKRPSQLDNNTYLYLFRQGIKPIWEDPANQGGGCLVIMAEKGKANRMWEDVLLAFISSTAKQTQVINGIRLKIKKDIAHIDIWLGEISQSDPMLQQAKKWVLQSVGLKEDTNIRFLGFNAES